jgi:hypothetical protein
VRGELERLERVHVQFLVDALGEPVAEARHGGQQLYRVGVAAQPLELDPPSRARHLEQRGGDAAADAGQRLEAGQPVARDDRGHVLIEGQHGAGGLAIGGHTERIGVLGLEQVGRLPQPVGALRIEPAGDVVHAGSGHLVGRGLGVPLAQQAGERPAGIGGREDADQFAGAGHQR